MGIKLIYVRYLEHRLVHSRRSINVSNDYSFKYGYPQPATPWRKGEGGRASGEGGACSPDGRITPHDAAGSSSSPRSADPGGGGTVPQGQVAKDERQHLLWQLLSRFGHGSARDGSSAASRSSRLEREGRFWALESQNVEGTTGAYVWYGLWPRSCYTICRAQCKTKIWDSLLKILFNRFETVTAKRSTKLLNQA